MELQVPLLNGFMRIYQTGSSKSWLTLAIWVMLICRKGYLKDAVESHLPKVHAYADDMQLYISFKPDASAAEMDAVDNLQACIMDIRNFSWTMLRLSFLL